MPSTSSRRDPLTNIALALERDPGIARLVASFTIMGGSSTRGNATPAAEFNIFADPEAAKIVFDADWIVTMVGLDLTLQAQANPTVIARMKELGRLADELIVPLATFYYNPADPGWDGQAVHDVCAVAYVARPDLFEGRKARVDIETHGEFTAGMTVVDFSAAIPNAFVPTQLDVDGFWAYVESVYARVAAEHQAIELHDIHRARGVSQPLADLLPAGFDPDGSTRVFADWAASRGLPLYPAQDEALIEIVSGANVILSTPTGTGKSLVAVAAHFAALAAGRAHVLHRADQGAREREVLRPRRHLRRRERRHGDRRLVGEPRRADHLLHGRDPREPRAAPGRGRARSTRS